MIRPQIGGDHDSGAQYVSDWARFVPATDRSGPRWDCSQLRPGELLCADEISFDHATNPIGQRQHLLFVYDVKTRGIRVEEERSKTEHGEKFRKMAINEAWNKRPYKVTVIADRCGKQASAMRRCLSEDQSKSRQGECLGIHC